MYICPSAEVQLYLAELKVLGANIAVDAKSPLGKEWSFLCGFMTKVAGLNKIPY